MAAALDLSYEVLNVFVNSHRNEMTLIELHHILTNRIPRITTDEVLRIVRLPNLINIFNLQSISNDLCLIQLNPKLTLCEDCLQKGCKKMNCTKLHLCRYLSHFSNKPLEKTCHFPHKLTEHPNNRALLRQYNYDTLDDNILLQLLRYHYEQIKRSSSSQSDYYHSSKTSNHRFNKSRPPSQLKIIPIPIDNLAERQLDISIPSERDTTEVDLEIVQLLLATKKIIVERILEKQISNEFYRRFTIQLKTKQIIDDILQTEPIIIYNKIPIKMKRTLRQKDKKIFALKFKTDKKIDNIRLNLYVETLVGKVNLNIFDMTPDGNNEQIYLIRCEQSIDFDHLYKVHSAKNTLQGYQVVITEIYETETLEISFVHQSLRSPPMTITRLRQLFGETRWQQDVFACLCIRDQNSADIELMNAEITAQWLAEANRFERDLSLLIRPIIDFIQSEEKNEDEDDEEITELLVKSNISSSNSPSNRSDDSQKGENDPSIYTIKPDWRIVLTHPVFGDEYRKYIREKLNISAQITGSAIQIPNEYIRKELARYTNMFIQNFTFRELSDLDKTQVKMIKDNYSRMAHKWQKDTNKTLVAARRDVINELFPQTTSVNRQQNKTTTPTFRYKPSPTPRKQDEEPNTPTFRFKQSPTPRKQEEEPSTPTYRYKQFPTPRKQDEQSTTPTYRYKQSPTPRKQDEQSTPPIVDESIETKTTEDNYHTLSYPIENSVYFPFFAPSNSFSARLNTYLSKTFNIKLDIKTISSTKIVLELKGQDKDISDARPALTALFGSLKTKTYSDKNDSCKFSIPDVYRVAQWNLDQCSIVSSCSFSTKNGGTLSVRYFANNPQFGVDEQQIDYILIHNLIDISYDVLITSKKLEANLQKLTDKIQQRSDYGQDICCLYNDQKELPSLHLCGIKSIVPQIYQEIKTIGDEYTPIPCTVQLKPNAVDYLLQICSNDLIKFEKDYENDGVDLRSKLKSDTISQFLAPKYLHEKIKLFLLEMSQIETISKDLTCSVQLINSKKQEFNNLAMKNRCLMTIKLSTQPKISATSNISSSGLIHISNGDLTTEQSDVLVVCSTSEKLRSIVVKAAGKQVEQELAGNDLTKTIVPTSAGQLKQAKRLLFIPWAPPATYIAHQDINALRQSISTFVQHAIKYTIEGKFQSIAFPAIGCGGFGISPDIIATIMIDAVNEQLTSNPGIRLKITFVIQQANVYDVFKDKLRPRSTSTTTSRSRSPSPSSIQEKVNITLTTSNSNIDIAKKLLTVIETALH